jgi:hypothetical protein
VNLSNQLDEAISTMPVPDALRKDKKQAELAKKMDDAEHRHPTEAPA